MVTLLLPPRAGQGRGKPAKLDISGTELIAAPRRRVYPRLLDLHFVARSAPAVTAVESVDARHFRVHSGFGIGPLKLKLILAIELFDLIDGVSASMRLRSTGTGALIDMVSKIRVEDAGPEHTRLAWWAGGEVKGAAAMINAKLMRALARRLTAEFWSDFARRVAQESQDPAGRS